MVKENKMVQTEIGLLPGDWEVILIGDGSDLDGGLAFKSSSFKTFGEYQVIKMANLYNGSLDLTRNVSYVSTINLSEEKYLTTEGDVLISLTGTTGKRDYGYTVYIKGNKKLLVNQRVGRIKSKENVISKYLYYFTKSIFFDRQFYELAKGGTGNQTNVSISDLKSLKIPLPPLTEQEAIASALSDVDAWIESLEQLIAKKCLIKQGAMQELLTPKEDWEVKKLGEIASIIIGLTYSPNDVRDFGTLVLRSSNIQNNKLAFENNVFVDMDLSERVIVKENDLLVCVRNGSKNLIGKCALIDKKTEGQAFGAFMSIIRSEFGKYLYHYFQTYHIQTQIEENLGATINQLTNATLKSFDISIPKSLSEQTRIATILSDMDVELEALATQLEKAKKIKRGMMQELLTGRIRLV